MNRNTLAATIRFLTHNKTFAILNITGLAVGLAAAIVIMAYVGYETSYDGWMADSGTYTFETHFEMPGRDPRKLARTPWELGPALEKDFPEFGAVTMFRAGETSVVVGPDVFSDDVFIVENNFFDVIDLDFVAGDSSSAFSDARSVVLTESAAQKYFGDQPALGQVLTSVANEFTVTGVVRDLPQNSHLTVRLLLHIAPDQFDSDFIDWSSLRVYTYARLGAGADISAVNARLEDFVDRSAVFAPEFLHQSPASEIMTLRALAFEDVHLYGEAEGTIKAPGNATTVFGFMAVSALIILIASINFVNLSTAIAQRRYREIAIRKIFGAERRALITQQLTESTFIALTAYVLALGLFETVGPWIYAGVNQPLLAAEPLSWSTIIGSMLIAALVGLGSGFYPAVQLARTGATSALGAERSVSANRARFRNFLVLTQFTVSIILISAALIYVAQARFAKSMNPGFAKDEIVVYRGVGGLDDPATLETLMNEMARTPGVTNVAASAYIPSDTQQNNASLVRIGAGDNARTSVSTISVSPGFFEAFGLELVAGRAIDANRPGDVFTPDDDESTFALAPVVINETAVRRLGLGDPASAIGARFSFSDYFESGNEAEVIGVTRDIHFHSIRSIIPPTMYVQLPQFYASISVRTGGRGAVELEQLDDVWTAVLPDRDISRTWLAETFDAQYDQEELESRVFTGFAALAVLIASLGIFGLSAFSAEQRQREVSIRKVLGASVRQILVLFLWQHSRPILVAALVAIPASWYFMQDWLSGFAYRIELGPAPFVFSALLAMAVAWITVSAHAVRAARTNPAEALRYE